MRLYALLEIVSSRTPEVAHPSLVEGNLLVLSGAARTGVYPHPGLEVPAAASAAAATAVVEAAPAAATVPATPATAKSAATCRESAR